MELQDEAETKECTFRPKIIASAAEEDDRDGGGGGRLPFHERLHKEAREREAARALVQQHLDREALRECTFQVIRGFHAFEVFVAGLFFGSCRRG